MNNLLEIAIIGQSDCGKSSIMRRLIQNTFDQNKEKPTINFVLETQKINISEVQYNVRIYDFQGVSDQCKLTLLPMWRQCKGFIVVMDVTSKSSFELAKKCYQQLIEQCHPQSQCMVVIGNKIDLKRNPQLTFQKVNEYWQKRQVNYVETSAKTNQGIQGMFKKLIKGIIIDLKFKQDKIQKQRSKLNKNNISLQHIQTPKQSKCSC